MLGTIQCHHSSLSGIDGRKVAAVSNVEVDASRATACGLFRSECASLRIVRPMLIGWVLKNIVVAGYICRKEDARTAAGCHGHQSARVEAVAVFAH